MVMGSRPRRRSAPSDVVLEGVPVVWASGVLVLEGPFSLSSPPPITRAAATPTPTAAVPRGPQRRIWGRGAAPRLPTSAEADPPPAEAGPPRPRPFTSFRVTD